MHYNYTLSVDFDLANLVEGCFGGGDCMIRLRTAFANGKAVFVPRWRNARSIGVD